MANTIDDGAGGSSGSSDGGSGSGSGGSGSGGGSGLAALLPYVDFLVRFASAPTRYVRSVIAQNIFKGLVTLAGFALAIVAKPFQVLEAIIRTAGDALIDATGPVGLSITGTIRDLNWSIGTAFETFGIAAPVVVWVLMVVELMLVFLFIRYLIRVVNPS